MEEILLTRCYIKEENTLETMFCLQHNGEYYSIKSLNKYHLYDGKNGILEAEILDENNLNDKTKEILQRRKEELKNRIKNNFYQGLGFEEDNNDKLKFVFYTLKTVALNDLAEVIFIEDKNSYLGIMANNAVYDIKSRKRIKTIADNLNFYDTCLSKVKIVPENTLEDENALLSLLLFIGQDDDTKSITK